MILSLSAITRTDRSSDGFHAICPLTADLSRSLIGLLSARLVPSPSLSLLLADSLKDRLSVSGPVTVPLRISAPSPPKVASTKPPISSFGALVVILITPAEAFLPNRVDCGPLNTSTRSRLGKSAREDDERDLGTPSISTKTAGSIPGLFAPLPKPRITKFVCAEL